MNKFSEGPNGRRRAWWNRPSVTLIIILLGLAGLISLLSPKHDTGLRMPFSNGEKSGVRKALVAASIKDQDVSWFAHAPKDWEIYQYISDDPLANLTVPRNQGREAMVYTTYIIDHYDDLPDYVIFMHGHETGWHQPEPMPMIMSALDLRTLDSLDWVSLRCQNIPSCEPEFTQLKPWDPNAGGNPGWQALLFKGLYDFVYRPEDPWFTPMPDRIAATCCAQFAVTKHAIRSKPVEFWKRLRAPMLRDIEKEFQYWGAGEETDQWKLGAAYERGWHYFFGKPGVTCYELEFCRNTIFSGRIHCDGQTTDWPHSQNYSDITCTLDQ